MITACKIVPVFLRAIDTVQPVPLGVSSPPPLSPCICMSSRISYAVARPFVKRIGSYTRCSFMRVFRHLDVSSLVKRKEKKKMQRSIAICTDTRAIELVADPNEKDFTYLLPLCASIDSRTANEIKLPSVFARMSVRPHTCTLRVHGRQD